jgi:hypothetical protein
MVPIYYNGISTDTIRINVNNTTREISADLLIDIVDPIDDSIVSLDFTWSSSKIKDKLNNFVVNSGSDFPINPTFGQMFFINLDDFKKPVWYNGEQWVDANGDSIYMILGESVLGRTILS